MRRPGLDTRLRPEITRSRLAPYLSVTTSVSWTSPLSTLKPSMYPSCSRMRAISRRMPELGISTYWWSARLAFRRRVSMSAIGSVLICSPAALGHARHHTLVRELAETDPADAELAVVAAGAAAARAAVVGPGRILRRALLLDPQ